MQNRLFWVYTCMHACTPVCMGEGKGSAFALEKNPQQESMWLSICGWTVECSWYPFCKSNTLLETQNLQFSSVHDSIYKSRKAYIFSPHLSPVLPFKTILMFFCWTITLYHPFQEDRWVLPLSTPFIQNTIQPFNSANKKTIRQAPANNCLHSEKLREEKLSPWQITINKSSDK